jgi:hypothetical protein
VLLGKVSVAWLSSMKEELVQKADANEFFKLTREGTELL